MPSRRDFLAAAALAATLPTTRSARAGVDDQTWLTYAVNVEMFWAKLPFLERLKKVSEAGFSHYEFWTFKTKDIPAIAKASVDLGLTPTYFSVYSGLGDPKRKEPFLSAVEDAIEVANALGVKKLGVNAGDLIKGSERDASIDAVIEGLKAAAEKVAEHEITLLIEPQSVQTDKVKPLVISTADAIEVIEAVESPHLKMLYNVYHQQVSEGDLSGNIKKHFSKIGYFHIADHPGRFQPGTGEINYPYILKLIQSLGYKDVIGLEMKPKGDPLDALKALREADTAAKALD
jgi:hydroxypyruvate isomerase